MPGSCLSASVQNRSKCCAASWSEINYMQIARYTTGNNANSAWSAVAKPFVQLMLGGVAVLIWLPTSCRRFAAVNLKRDDGISIIDALLSYLCIIHLSELPESAPSDVCYRPMGLIAYRELSIERYVTWRRLNRRLRRYRCQILLLRGLRHRLRYGNRGSRRRLVLLRRLRNIRRLRYGNRGSCWLRRRSKCLRLRSGRLANPETGDSLALVGSGSGVDLDRPAHPAIGIISIQTYDCVAIGLIKHQWLRKLVERNNYLLRLPFLDSRKSGGLYSGYHGLWYVIRLEVVTFRKINFHIEILHITNTAIAGLATQPVKTCVGKMSSNSR